MGFLDIYLPLRAMHIVIAIVFLILSPFAIHVHIRRFYNKNPIDFVSWLHILLFAFILLVTTKMLRHWIPKNYHEHFEEPNTVHWSAGGKKVDISSFVSSHPGGKSNISKVLSDKHRGKTLEKIWDEENVGWHKTNQKVQNTLKSLAL